MVCAKMAESQNSIEKNSNITKNLTRDIWGQKPAGPATLRVVFHSFRLFSILPEYRLSPPPPPDLL